MTRRPWIFGVILFSAIAPLVLVGCGGGGGGGGDPSADLLSGAYAYVVVVRDVAGNQVRTETGFLASDAGGTLTLSSTYIVGSGVSVGPLTLAAATYTEGADRVLAITGLAGVPLRGRVASNGSLALLSSRDPDDPAMAILVRRDTAPAIGDLAGVWARCSWLHRVAPARASSDFGFATVSAKGVFDRDSAGYIYNLDGAVSPGGLFLLREQLALQPGGWVVNTVPPSTTVVRRGAISADGNLILLGGDVSGANQAGVTILLREGHGLSDAALTGNYYESNFESSILGFLDGWGPVNLDGAGAGTWSYTFNVEGGSFGQAPIDLGYSVDPNGVVGFGDAPGTLSSWVGMVGGGGRYVVLAGGFTPGSDPILMMFLR